MTRESGLKLRSWDWDRVRSKYISWGGGAKAEAGGNGSIIRPRARGQDTQGLRGRVLKAPQS